jgi:hypothetical protein
VERLVRQPVLPQGGHGQHRAHGHSRGGEAVAVAAAFNRLSHYPDDATIKFTYNFDIKSIVAIAPVDGQYQPAGKPTPSRT